MSQTAIILTLSLVFCLDASAGAVEGCRAVRRLRAQASADIEATHVKTAFTLPTPQLVLSDFRAEDLTEHAAELDGLFTNVENVKYMAFAHPEEEFLRKMYPVLVAKAIRDADESPRTHYTLAVRERGSNRIIGYARCDLDPRESGAAAIGYLFVPETAGKGYAKETARALVEMAFTRLQVKKVNAYIDPAPEVAPSRSVVKSAGLVAEPDPEDEHGVRTIDGRNHYGPTRRQVFSVMRAGP